jgi:WhiB family redox-sensing transcriptional regulator
MNWRELAACRGSDPELWFPISEEHHTPQVETAKTICRRCPVLEQCRAWAIPHQPYGIAGGMTEDERRRARRQENQPSQRAAAQITSETERADAA